MSVSVMIDNYILMAISSKEKTGYTVGLVLVMLLVLLHITGKPLWI
jgi:hypothetical protein